jgi:acyl-CoA dehydrogenase
VNELCEILDDYSITENRDFPEEFWTRCKEQGFFGMIIPKAYGGKGFSAHGHSMVVQKVPPNPTTHYTNILHTIENTGYIYY